MTKSSQLSIYGLTLINAMLANRHYKVHPNTTLNEKFNILPDSRTPVGPIDKPNYPKPRYFVIGVGGTQFIDNIDSYKFSEHRVTDAALFQHIPFALKPIVNDFSYDERLNYRLRTLVSIKGEEYYAYYAKKVELIDYRNYNFIVNKVGEADVLSIMDFNSYEYLNPKPIVKPSDPKKALDLSTVINRFKFEFLLTEEEQKELKNVLNLLDLNDVNKLTELGICHGYDTTVGYGLESIDTQITYFVDTDIDVALDLNSTSSFQRNIELGGAEPFYR